LQTTLVRRNQSTRFPRYYHDTQVIPSFFPSFLCVGACTVLQSILISLLVLFVCFLFYYPTT
jgi:hypothetical protein